MPGVAFANSLKREPGSFNTAKFTNGFDSIGRAGWIEATIFTQQW